MPEKNELNKEELKKVSGGIRIRGESSNTQVQDGSISTFDTMDKQNQSNNTNDDGMVVQHKI